MRNIIIFAAIALALGAVVPKLYANRAPVIATAVVEQPAQQGNNNSRSVTINRANNGHFMTEAVIDGRRMDFMVDTGASVIALRERDAGRLGVFPSPSQYTAQVSTANGMIKAAPVDLRRVEIGGVEVRNVAALVLPDEALAQNLLGMSFLSRLRWEQRNGKLVLEQ